jgi:hypothetical protein
LDERFATPMSLAKAIARQEVQPVNVGVRAHAGRRTDVERVARAGVIALIVVAPFEALRPLVSVPGQSLTTVEATLAAVLLVAAWAAVRSWTLSVLPVRELLPWSAFVLMSLIAALAAPTFRSNALHMAVRYSTMAIVFGLTLVAARSPRGLRSVLVGTVGGATVVALLVIADFTGVGAVQRFLSAFRDGIAVVGAQVRASGPFQYPTIASMYLEIAFALGLGLLVTFQRGWTLFALTTAALALMAEAVTLTFTRSGLLTIGVSLAVVGGTAWWRNGFDRSSVAIGVLAGVLAVEVLSSRSAEMLRLRLTSETQGSWFSAVIEPPPAITLRTREVVEVPLMVTNVGRATWDSSSAEPVQVSYHWISADSDDVVWWEGDRTAFSSPVSSGSSVKLVARVRAPEKAGRYRVMWDLEQRYRLWFSTEPGARVSWSDAEVSGVSTPLPQTTGPRHVPAPAVRPGRSVLWLAAWRMFRSRPLLGVGPDNYRLLYGSFASVQKVDPRVHSNNMYLEILAGTGILGLAGAVWIGVGVARACLRALRLTPAGAGLAAACLGIAVHGVFDSFLGFTGTYIAIAVALGLAVSAGHRHTRHAYRV